MDFNSSFFQILHFFNTPPGLDEDQLKQVFIDGGVTEPKSIKLFPSKSKCEWIIGKDAGSFETNFVFILKDTVWPPLVLYFFFLLCKSKPL